MIYLFAVWQNGQALIKAGHYASAEVQEILDDLNHQWSDLKKLAADKQQKLQQARLHSF